MPPMEDHLSALPVEILRYILSFLPTKFAFTTTVLSKRWTPLCYSLTALQESYTRFHRFVDNVLLSHRAQHNPIETLSLVSDRFKSNADEWIEAAKRRGVKNLQVSTRDSYLHLLPGVFNSRTLVVLKLSKITVDHEYEYAILLKDRFPHPKEYAVPECVSLQLKTFFIGYYPIESMYEDFDIVAYILQNARVLEVLTFQIDTLSWKLRSDQFFKYLSRCPRISQACKIECKVRL